MAMDSWIVGDAPQQGLGSMRWTDESWGDDDRDPAALVLAALDAGVSLLDTAEMYGNEELVGRAIAGQRERITLCSKFGVYWGPGGWPDDWEVRADPATVRTAIDGSLQRLGVDHLDLYYLHHRSEDTPIEETVGAMAELREAGKIRALGLSNVTLDDIRRAHAVHPIAAVQEQWSLAHRNVEEFLPTLAELGITLVAHSPLGHGGLARPDSDDPLGRAVGQVADRIGASPAQIALAWVHHRGRQAEATVIPLPGTTSINRLRANVAAAQFELSDADLDELEAASRP